MADKPDKFPDWALEEQADPVSGQLNRVEPPEFRKETGWQRREIPPRQWFNWQAWLTGRWIRWIVPILEGLGTASTQSDDRYNHRSNNLSDVANASAARSNLGLGSAATQADTRYAHRANNLSDLASASAARNNLGLGTEQEIRDLSGISVESGSGVSGGIEWTYHAVIVGGICTMGIRHSSGSIGAGVAPTVFGVIPSGLQPSESHRGIMMGNGGEIRRVTLNSNGDIATTSASDSSAIGTSLTFVYPL